MAKFPKSEGWESAGWREWYAEMLGRVVGHLTAMKAGEGSAVRHVHETRKILKRLRSVTKMLRYSADRDALQKARKACREAGRLFADSRDGSVRLQTFDRVMGRRIQAKRGPVVEVRAWLVEAAAEGEIQAAEEAKAALRVLRNAALKKTAWKSAGREEVVAGLRRLLKKARMDFFDLQDANGEEYHEWRKRVKDLYYPLEALSVEPTVSLDRLMAALKRLADTLGEENDLVVLLEWLDEQGFRRRSHPTIWKPAEERLGRLRARALREGGVLDRLARMPLLK